MVRTMSYTHLTASLQRIVYLGFVGNEDEEDSQGAIYYGLTSQSAKDLRQERLDTIQATHFDVAVLQVSVG